LSELRDRPVSGRIKTLDAQQRKETESGNEKSEPAGKEAKWKHNRSGEFLARLEFLLLFDQCKK